MDPVDSTTLRQYEAHNDEVQVDRRKDDFIALLAHELRNPLSAILGALQILDQSEGVPPKAKELHNVIRRQSQLMKTLSEELLDVSRIANGKILLQKKRLDFTALARNTIADYGHCFEAHQLKLETVVSPESLCVVGDGVRLSQVITNLLHNATKFSDSEGTIQVRVEREGTSVELSVRDIGIGMTPMEVSALFRPYWQASSTRVRCKGGLGLGLSLSKRLIEMHEGVIFATSEGLGCGSTFTIRLPLAEAIPRQLLVSVPQSVSPQSHRILIVDDRRDARLVLSVLLKTQGQEVHEAETGTAALDEMETFRPEIVFCDIGLPDMEGYAVATAIRLNPALKGVYLVALTGSGGAEDKEKALAAGFDRHMTKPISYDQLRGILLGDSVGSSS